MYDEPSADKPCFKCESREYDTNLDEKWCNHDPSPEELPYRSIIDNWGTCEYWKLADFYKEIK